jgi:Holliday junction DNA helicase RuvA
LIGYLRGRVLRSTPEQVLLDTGGVGYLVHIPLSTFYEIERAGAKDAIVLHVHTHVREDALALFGFWTENELRLFEKLIAVSGIGPRLAQAILSGMAPEDLVRAITAGDVARLTTIPGVGKKTAERTIVELRDRLKNFAADSEGAPARAEPAEDDLVTALSNLGYKPAQAERVVAQVRRANPEAAFHELLRQSLKRLSRV